MIMMEEIKRKMEGPIAKVLRYGILRGLDQQYCSRMLTMGSRNWTIESTRKLWEILKDASFKYDFNRYEIDFASIPEPPLAPPPLPSRRAEPESVVRFTSRSIDLDDSRNFTVRFPFDRSLVDALKQVPYQSRTLCKKTYTWTVRPRKGEWIDVAAVNALYQFGMMNSFTWSDEAEREIRIIREEVIRQLHKTANSEQASSAKDADIEIEGLGGVLRPFQKAGVAYALKHKRVFIADDMGLGKTPQSIATAKAANAFPLLIITKKALKSNWCREVQKWIPNHYVTRDPKDMKSGTYKVCVINYDVIIKYEEPLQDIDWKCIVLDESHACKNKQTKRTKAVIELMKVAKPEYRLCLTGTPIKNRPKEFLPQLVILDQQHIVGGEWPFLNRYCVDNVHNGFDGANHMQELNTILRRHCYIRRLKKDVLTELPPKQHAIIELDIENMKQYLEAEQDIARYLIQCATELDEEKKKEIQEKARQHEQLMKVGILKRMAAHGKIAALKEWIEDFIDSGEKLIIFAHHIEIQKAARNMFLAITVGTGDSKGAQWAVDEFQRNPECKIIVCSLERDKEGHTLTAASNVLFIEEPWTPADVDQASDRAHRIGQSDSVTVWFALARNTIDMDIHELIEEKRAIVTAATNGGEYVAQQSIIHELIGRIKKKIA